MEDAVMPKDFRVLTRAARVQDPARLLVTGRHPPAGAGGRGPHGRDDLEAIGMAIGTTRQGAFNRFGALVQRYEVAGLLDEVSDGADLVLDDGEAKMLSTAIVEKAGGSRLSARGARE